MMKALARTRPQLVDGSPLVRRSDTPSSANAEAGTVAERALPYFAVVRIWDVWSWCEGPFASHDAAEAGAQAARAQLKAASRQPEVRQRWEEIKAKNHRRLRDWSWRDFPERAQ